MLYGAWRRMHLVKSVVFIIILWCSFRIICKIIHMRRFSFQLLCRLLTRRVAPRSLERHKSRANDGSSDRWKQRALRIKYCFPMKKTEFLQLMAPWRPPECARTRWWPQLISGLWLVESDHITWILACDWASVWVFGDQVMTSTDIVVVTRNKDITRYSEPRVTWDQGAIVCRKCGGKIGGLAENLRGIKHYTAFC